MARRSFVLALFAPVLAAFACFIPKLRTWHTAGTYVEIGGKPFKTGYTGTSSFDAGIFYCPYIPLYTLPVMSLVNDSVKLCAAVEHSSSYAHVAILA